MVKLYKRIVVSLMTVGMIFALAACSSGTAESQSAESSVEMPVEGEIGGRDDKVPDPNAPKLTVVSLYVKDDTTGGIDKEMDSIDSQELDANLLLQKLIEYGVIPADTTMLSFVIEGKKATLDLSALDTADKRILVALANTYLENYEIDALTVKIAGQSTANTTDIEYNLDYKTVTSN